MEPSASPTTAPAITSTPASSWNVEVDVDEPEDSLEAKPQYVDEVDSKPSTFINHEHPTTTTAGSVEREDIVRSGEYTTTTISTVPLTTVRQEDGKPYPFAPPNRNPFGRQLDDQYNSEDEEDQEEGEDNEEEDDYFSQGVRITVLPPNLPPLLPRADDVEPATSTLTTTLEAAASMEPINSAEQTRSFTPSVGMASPGAATATAETSTDSSAIRMTASQNQNTLTTTTTPTPPNSASNNIPTTTAIASTATPTNTITTASTATSYATTTAAPASYPSTTTTTLAPEPDTVATSTTLELQVAKTIIMLP
uniref:Uncharacterized protein n=1 Tax=Anopheles maculatus TaxID=74869 RepID=A0A182SMN7_9DIPT